MSHIDPLEPRRLCAAGFDPTFGKNGDLPLSEDYFLNGVLATHGEIYVDTFHAKRGRRQIFKYSDAGVLDTAWGTNGYIVPGVYAESNNNDPLTLVRDDRTGGLLVGGTLKQTLTIERHTASGAGDASWGGLHIYTEARTDLTVASITALPHKRVLLAFKREQQRGKDAVDLTSRKGGADDVALLMLDRRGRYDRSFNGGHAVRAAAGSYTQTRTNATNADGSVRTYTHVEDFSEPTFGDVQFRADGSLRVIVTRLAARTTTVDVTDYNQVEPGGPTTTSSHFEASVESTAVSADGVVLPDQSQTYLLKRGKRSTDGYTFNSYASYVPVLAVADDADDGVAVLGNTDSGSTIIRLAPGRRSRVQSVGTPRGDTYISETARTPGRKYVFRTGGPVDGPRLYVLDSHLVPLADGTFVGDYDTIYYSYITADDTNRILTIEAGRLKNVELHVTRYPAMS